MRKVALASALTLLLTIGAVPTVISSPASDPSSHLGAADYLPIANDWEFPIGDPRIAPTYDASSPNGYRITQMFNNSCDPSLGQGFYYAGQYWCGHTGVDLSNMQAGGVVRAAASGLVVYAGYNTSYGEMVRIEHLLPDGSYVYTQYEHLLWGSIQVWPNQIVTIGQQIGNVGATGFVTGAHLHFEVKSVNEDGVGYTFGNSALIAGYYEPISFIETHTAELEPTSTATTAPLPTATATATESVTNTTPLTSTNTVSASTDISTSTDVTATGAMTTGEQRAVLADFYKQYHDYVTVTADHLNVRSGPGFQYAALNSVTEGARLGYLHMTGNGWVAVALPSNVYGYVARQWVEGDVLPKLSEVAIAPHITGPMASVLDARYPARVRPRMSAPALEPLKVGEEVVYIGTMTSWDKVALPDGRIAWILNWYLHESSPRIDLTPVHTAQTVQPDHKAPGAEAPLPQHRMTSNSTARQQVTTTKQTPTVRGQATTTKQTSATHGQTTTTKQTSATHGQTTTTKQTPTVAGPYVVTTVDGLNLREAPRLSGRVIESLSRGTRLGLRGYHTSWAAVVAPDGAKGYVVIFFIHTVGAVGGNAVASSTTAQSGKAVVAPHISSTTPATKEAAPQQHVAAGFVAPYLYVSVTGGANLRAQPNLKAPVLVAEPLQTKLSLHGSEGSWVFVETSNGTKGWMMKDLISLG